MDFFSKSRKLYSKESLVTRFSIISFFLLTAIAVLLTLEIQRDLTNHALDQAGQAAANQVSAILSTSLTPADFENPQTPARYDQINTIVQQYILSDQSNVRVKIWRSDGVVLYSDEKEIVGNVFPLEDDLREALDGSVNSSVSELKEQENIAEQGRYERLLEVYAPIKLRDSNATVGVFELYQDTRSLDQILEQKHRRVLLYVAVGFMILFVSLFGLVRNASRKLVQSKEDKFKLFDEEQTRRSELSALYDISRSVAETPRDLDANLNMIVRQVVNSVHCTFACIAVIRDEKITWFAAHPVRELSQSLSLGMEWQLSDCPFCCQVHDLGTPLTVRNDSAFNISPLERAVFFLDVADTVCLIPLRSGGRRLGMLLLGEQRKEKREPISPDKIRLAAGIADATASVILRAELFAQVEDFSLQTVTALANAVEARDSYTEDHAERLAALALNIGQNLGMSIQDVNDLHYGAILHDVGKIGVPDQILNKPGKLDEAEWKIMKQHPVIGEGILSPLPQMANISKLVRHHHERYDGNGYPDGLKGDEIPFGARIIAVVDSFSAMCDRRVYKEAMSTSDAVEELKCCSGTQFDPRIVETFVKYVDL